MTPGADGSLDHIFIQDLGSVEGEGAAFQVDADGQLTLGSTRLLSSAAYPWVFRVRDVSLRYDSASGIFTVALQVGTADSTPGRDRLRGPALNHTPKSSAPVLLRLGSMKKAPPEGCFFSLLKAVLQRHTAVEHHMRRGAVTVVQAEIAHTHELERGCVDAGAVGLLVECLRHLPHLRLHLCSR